MCKFNNMDVVFHTVEYLGKAGLNLNTPFKNLDRLTS